MGHEGGQVSAETGQTCLRRFWDLAVGGKGLSRAQECVNLRKSIHTSDLGCEWGMGDRRDNGTSTETMHQDEGAETARRCMVEETAETVTTRYGLLHYANLIRRTGPICFLFQPT
jgi:hypothetical protein